MKILMLDLFQIISTQLSGTSSIMTMVIIGYDRYNVIVKGFSGTKITSGKAAGILLLLWAYSIIGCCPPFFGWGGYALGKYHLKFVKKQCIAWKHLIKYCLTKSISYYIFCISWCMNDNIELWLSRPHTNILFSLSEGLLVTCSYDYLTEDWNHKSYMLFATIMNYGNLQYIYFKDFNFVKILIF